MKCDVWVLHVSTMSMIEPTSERKGIYIERFSVYSTMKRRKSLQMDVNLPPDMPHHSLYYSRIYPSKVKDTPTLWAGSLSLWVLIDVPNPSVTPGLRS